MAASSLWTLSSFAAGAKIPKLYKDAALTTEGYQFASGETVYAMASGLTASRGYKFEVLDPSGVQVKLGECKTGSTTATDNFSAGAVSNSADFKWVLHEWTSSTCASGALSEDADNTLAFNVAQATAYPTAGLVTAQTTFNAGDTVYVKVEGLSQSLTAWSVTWIPSAGSGCANTGGGDRPASDANGRLPSTAGSFLQYQPNATATGDAWNRQANYDGPCPALSTSNGGQWQLKLQKDTTHSVTFNVFVNATPVPPTAVNDSYSMSPNTTLTVDAASGVLANDIHQRPVQAILGASPAHGTLTMFSTDGSFVYVADVGFNGTDTFTYNEMDSTGLASNTATVTITVRNDFTFKPCSNFAYPSGSPPTLSSVIFNESEVLRAFGASPDGKIVAWYNDEHALTLGVRRVIVIGGANPGTTDYDLTPLSTDPGTAIDPKVGTTILSGDQAGTDTATWNSTYGFIDKGRPLWPALFITDITAPNQNSTAGDWQQGGTAAIPPHAVFGTWKGAVRTVNYTALTGGHATITVTADADPATNNWNLGTGADTPPGGFALYANEGYGAEARWDASRLGLTPGHKYRLEFMVHDGDQNKSGGDSGEGCMEVTAPVSQAPTLSLEKTADPTTYSAAGQTINYSYKLTNGGVVTLSAPYSVTDDKVTVTCPSTPSTLPAGQFVTCTASYTTTQGDVTFGSVTNHATGHAVYNNQPVDSNPAQATVTAVQNPSLTIAKDTTQTTISAPGVINYTIAVHNTGNVDQTNVVVSDAFADAGSLTKVSGDTIDAGVLNVGETWNYTATHTATQAEINAGANLVNVARVVTTQVPGPTEDEATTTVTQTPSLTIAKDTTQTTISAPGVINYTIAVHNTGNVDQTNVVVSDAFADAGSLTKVSGDTIDAGVLNVGETWNYTATHTATQAEINAGANLVNVAVVDTDQTEPQQDDATTTVTQNASLKVEKEGVVTTITYSYKVKNDGNVTLSTVSLLDDKAGTITGCGAATLAPGAETTCTAVYTVTPADIEAHQVTNTATASGIDPNGAEVHSNPVVRLLRWLFGTP